MAYLTEQELREALRKTDAVETLASWWPNLERFAREVERLTIGKQQVEVMRFDPATGNIAPHPSSAREYRKFHGNVAWLFNPWTGKRRDPRDIGSDVMGELIVPSSQYEPPQVANSLDPWCAGTRECPACGTTWVAVWPLGADNLECPACGAYHAVRKEDESHEVVKR